jgi:hypothetical protein
MVAWIDGDPGSIIPPLARVGKDRTSGAVLAAGLEGVGQALDILLGYAIQRTALAQAKAVLERTSMCALGRHQRELGKGIGAEGIHIALL